MTVLNKRFVFVVFLANSRFVFPIATLKWLHSVATHPSHTVVIVFQVFNTIQNGVYVVRTETFRGCWLGRMGPA